MKKTIDVTEDVSEEELCMYLQLCSETPKGFDEPAAKKT